MAQVCKVCQLGRKTVQKLEQDYVDGLSKSKISRTYDVSYDSVSFHLQNHLPAKVARGAELQLTEDGFNLMERIDQLLERMENIFQRNYDKQHDRLALEALNSQRSTLELLAKISVELHRAKALEIEQKQHERFDVKIPLERLTEKEQELLFQLNMKLLGESETVDISDFESIEEVKDNGQDSNVKKLARTKFHPDH
ncbi:hypothetical protein ACFLU5_01305 [Bacteroidota bacterium]